MKFIEYNWIVILENLPYPFYLKNKKQLNITIPLVFFEISSGNSHKCNVGWSHKSFFLIYSLI